MHNEHTASRHVASRLAVSLAALLLSAAAFASDWKYYETKRYGFSMLVPSGTRLNTREWGGGWGGISGTSEDVKFHGQAKLGAKESNEDIERYAVNLIGVPAGAWVKVDQVQNTRGWERGYVFKANVGSRLLFGMYGVGAKGNYLLYLDTTAEDYMNHKKDYDKWYESIRLD
jgi:hypothetical protein